MSYDLYLKPRTGSIDAATVLDYFRRRPKYTVSGEQAGYENEDTGVAFFFNINHGEPGEPTADYPVLFNLAYFRPSFFSVEAEPEVTAFVRSFDCVVLDPQTDGMGQGEYQADKLVAGWRCGNQFACQAVLALDNAPNSIFTLPADKLHTVWQWNYDRASFQDRIENDRFVPLIVFLQVDGRLSTAIVWGDGVAMAFPVVDYILVARRELAPRRWIKQTPDTTLLTWQDAVEIMEPYICRYGDGSFGLSYDRTPEPLRDAIRRLGRSSQTLQLVGAESVLDAELIDKFLKPR
ncbi:MAG: hypothetical protein JOY64_34215 [Alphaproteobacteria bacterium]|nr:hypothetical protein [Alphaproteobacteria bacterium]MBV8412722.1 hypothetical protein [Alphaproteobacteria bacterium]